MLYILIGIELFLSFMAILILENDVSHYNWSKRFFWENFRTLIFDFLKKLLFINLVILFLMFCISLIQHGLIEINK